MNKKKIAIVLGIIVIVAVGTVTAISASGGKQKTEMAVAMQEDVEEAVETEVETVEDDTGVSSEESEGGQETEVVENDINDILNPDLDPDLHVTFGDSIEIDDVLLTAIKGTKVYAQYSTSGAIITALEDTWESDFNTDLNIILHNYHEGLLDRATYIDWLKENKWPEELEGLNALDNSWKKALGGEELAETAAQWEANKQSSANTNSSSSSNTNSNDGQSNGGYDAVNWEPDPAEVSSGGGSGQVTLPPGVPILTPDDIGNKGDAVFTGIY